MGPRGKLGQSTRSYAWLETTLKLRERESIGDYAHHKAIIAILSLLLTSETRKEKKKQVATTNIQSLSNSQSYSDRLQNHLQVLSPSHLIYLSSLPPLIYISLSLSLSHPPSLPYLISYLWQWGKRKALLPSNANINAPPPCEPLHRNLDHAVTITLFVLLPSNIVFWDFAI